MTNKTKLRLWLALFSLPFFMLSAYLINDAGIYFGVFLFTVGESIINAKGDKNRENGGDDE